VHNTIAILSLNPLNNRLTIIQVLSAAVALIVQSNKEIVPKAKISRSYRRTRAGEAEREEDKDLR